MQGPTARWACRTAKRLQCKVCVGYPEVENIESNESTASRVVSIENCFNSLLVVDENGEVVLNYRKRFLYYTDEAWASEGEVNGFRTLGLKSSTLGLIHRVPTSFGICMDINPYRFEAPYTAWEFANQVLESQSQLVLLPMAWLTSSTKTHLLELGSTTPDMHTFNYWIGRFWPLIERQKQRQLSNGGNGTHPVSVEDSDGDLTDQDIVLVFANRSGEEDGGRVIPSALYAGTSTIIALRSTRSTAANGEINATGGLSDCQILCWDMKGALEEGICFADTTTEPKMIFRLAKKAA
jgi:protein N-terminal amidase